VRASSVAEPQESITGSPPRRPYQQIGGMLRFLQVLRIVGFVGFALWVGLWVTTMFVPMLVTVLAMASDELMRGISDELTAMWTLTGMGMLFVLLVAATGLLALLAIGQLLRRCAKFLRTWHAAGIAALLSAAALNILAFTQWPSATISALIYTAVVVVIYALCCAYYMKSERVRVYVNSPPLSNNTH